MGVTIKKSVTKVENLRSVEKEVSLYLRPVRIQIDAEKSICTFWAEGRENDIHGERFELKDFTFGIDKKGNLFDQIYAVIKREWPDATDA